MTARPLSLESETLPSMTPKPRLLEKVARQAILSRLRTLSDGEIILRDGATYHRFGRTTARCPLSVVVTVTSPQFYPKIAFGGSVGAGAAYMAGYWQASDLTGLVRIFLSNRQVLDGIDGGLARLTDPFRKAFHRLNRNTVKGSRRNISAHYDLGNDFFALFLDESLMYSSAMFIEPAMTLHQAQIARLRHICDKLELRPTDHVLEIGAGWGGFAAYAAKQYGCRVTTTTISNEQYAFTRRRVESAGLSDHVRVLRSDYRDLAGQYDKLVSLEMIEAVGHEYFDAYFATCSGLLKPDGMMLLQAITIADQRYEAAKTSVDFIKRYIFPGSCIPSVTAMSAAMTRASDMRVFHLEDIGSHYAATLRAWRSNLHRNREQIHALGYSDDFFRMWEFYFSYCEGAFLERAISDVQMLLVKPDNRRTPVSSCGRHPCATH